MKRVALLCLSLIALFTFTTLGNCACCSVEALFVSPSVDEVIESRIIELLDDAEDSIYIAMYSFTDDQLGYAVMRAYNREVAVRVLFEDERANEQGGEYDFLHDNNVSVKLAVGGRLLHHKFAVIDNETVITGSYNWSDSADTRNFENVLIVHCAEIANAYITEFERIWNSGEGNGTNGCEECLRRINEATITSLEGCSGIGKTLAPRIVEYQPFTVNTCTRTAIKLALQEVPGIGSSHSEDVVKCLCGDLELD